VILTTEVSRLEASVSSVNFVLDSTVFSFSSSFSLTELYFRFRLIPAFACIFVFVSVFSFFVCVFINFVTRDLCVLVAKNGENQQKYDTKLLTFPTVSTL